MFKFFKLLRSDLLAEVRGKSYVLKSKIVRTVIKFVIITKSNSME